MIIMIKINKNNKTVLMVRVRVGWLVLSIITIHTHSVYVLVWFLVFTA